MRSGPQPAELIGGSRLTHSNLDDIKERRGQLQKGGESQPLSDFGVREHAMAAIPQRNRVPRHGLIP